MNLRLPVNEAVYSRAENAYTPNPLTIAQIVSSDVQDLSRDSISGELMVAMHFW